MSERDYLAERFEEHRTHLRAVAYRMLGSLSEVDDAVQEAWLRLSRADAAGAKRCGIVTLSATILQQFAGMRRVHSSAAAPSSNG